jgi:hypothetical protein
MNSRKHTAVFTTLYLKLFYDLWTEMEKNCWVLSADIWAQVIVTQALIISLGPLVPSSSVGPFQRALSSMPETKVFIPCRFTVKQMR